MRKVFSGGHGAPLLLLGLVLATPCSAGDLTSSLGADLGVRLLKKGAWLHTSMRASDGVWANGLVFEGQEGLVLVDTGWTEDQTRRLLEWGESATSRRFVEVVVTHSHEDRAGGLGAVYSRGIKVVASDLTVAKLRAEGAKRLPEAIVTASRPVALDPLGFEAFYPGAAHTVDNITVYVPELRLLFGGCMVRAAATLDLGFTRDADLASWPKAIEALEARYSDADIVVPGHGEVGDRRTLAHTLELLRKER